MEDDAEDLELLASVPSPPSVPPSASDDSSSRSTQTATPLAQAKKKAAKLTKAEIETSIRMDKRTNKTILFFRDQPKKPSFERIFYAEDGDEENALKCPTNHVRCKVCSGILWYEGGHLERHAQSHVHSPPAKRQRNDGDIRTLLTTDLSPAEVGQMARIFGKYALDSSSSFRSCESDAFRDMAVELINLG